MQTLRGTKMVFNERSATTEFVLQRQGPPIIRPSHLFSLIVVLAAAGLVALFALDSYFVVQPTEMAGVRRLGQVVTAKPLGPGPHFKLPLIDQVDRLQVSLDTFKSTTLPSTRSITNRFL